MKGVQSWDRTRKLPLESTAFPPCIRATSIRWRSKPSNKPLLNDAGGRTSSIGKGPAPRMGRYERGITPFVLPTGICTPRISSVRLATFHRQSDSRTPNRGDQSSQGAGGSLPYSHRPSGTLIALLLKSSAPSAKSSPLHQSSYACTPSMSK